MCAFYKFHGSSLVAQLLQGRRPWFDPWVGKIFWRRNRLPSPIFLGFPGDSDMKSLPALWETWVQSLGW